MVAVANAREALAAVRAQVPDAIVCDMGLPDEDGSSLMKKIRALDGPAASVPAVAFTAWGQPQDRERTLSAGFQAHLLKPVEPWVLVDAVVRVTGRVPSGPRPQPPASTRS